MAESCSYSSEKPYIKASVDLNEDPPPEPIFRQHFGETYQSTDYTSNHNSNIYEEVSNQSSSITSQKPCQEGKGKILTVLIKDENSQKLIPSTSSPKMNSLASNGRESIFEESEFSHEKSHHSLGILKRERLRVQIIEHDIQENPGNMKNQGLFEQRMIQNYRIFIITEENSLQQL
jgi:hypothetical protein